MKIGSGKKGPFPRPERILVFYPNIGHTNLRFYELEDIHDGRFKKKKFFRPEISTPFFILLKSKKGLNLSFFRKRTHTLSILTQNKIFLFFQIVSHL